MLELPQVTLIALTNKNIPEHEEAIRKSCEGIEFGAVKLIVDYKCTSIDIWNYKILYELHNYIDTDFAMLIHPDGYVIRPDLWRDSWLELDFIGSPWPLPQDNYSYRTLAGDLVRVGNSVSLRSKRIMELPSKLGLEFKPFFGNSNEDGKLCVEWRDILQREGIKYAPIEVAKYFSREHDIPENQGLETFAFHTVDK